MPLQIHPLGASASSARPADYGWRGPGEARGVYRGAGGARWLLRARGDSARRVEDRYSVDGAPRALDRTVFWWDDEQFVEAERYRSAGGPNLHARPISLPASMAIDAPTRPLEGLDATVMAVYAGPVELRLGRLRARTSALALRAEESGAVRLQWLAWGVGELAIGPEGAPPARWLLAWSGGAQSLLKPLPEALMRLPLPPLSLRVQDAEPGKTLL